MVQMDHFTYSMVLFDAENFEIDKFDFTFDSNVQKAPIF